MKRPKHKRQAPRGSSLTVGFRVDDDVARLLDLVSRDRGRPGDLHGVAREILATYLSGWALGIAERDPDVLPADIRTRMLEMLHTRSGVIAPLARTDALPPSIAAEPKKGVTTMPAQIESIEVRVARLERVVLALVYRTDSSHHSLSAEGSVDAKDIEALKVSACNHGVHFDDDCFAANTFSVTEIRRRWPRGEFTAERPCPKGCGYVGIAYASFKHYVAGDW